MPPSKAANFDFGTSDAVGRNTEAINFNPPQNNEMHFMDDDEDLR